jgi:hypothetical protein
VAKFAKSSLTGVLALTDGSPSTPARFPMTPRQVTIGDLETAINRARSTQPASGPESVLTLEMATLAALYGRLIWERVESIDFDRLTDGERIALRLWLPPPVQSPRARPDPG